MTDLAFDKAISFRWHDDDGRLHVDRSNLTRVQVAPYMGKEIPGWEALKLDPEKIYYGYRPAEELGSDATIKSVIGIPIQLNHHLDYPDDPAMDTRVGSTGDLAKFDGTYLSNSLHIQNEDACRRIRDGSMKQLSLAYHYRPDFKSTGVFNGQNYDFTMRDIRGQHLALVEEGRAGSSCCVSDHALQTKVKDMDGEKKTVNPVSKDGDPGVESAEVKIAELVRELSDLLRALHKKGPDGQLTDVGGEGEGADEGGEGSKIQKVLAAFAKLNASEEDMQTLKGILEEIASGKGDDEAATTASTEEGEKPDDGAKDDDDIDGAGAAEGEADVGEGEGESGSELSEAALDAIKRCGFDNESDDFKKAFAAGLEYGEAGNKLDDADQGARDEEPKIDDKGIPAQDAAIKAFEKKLEAMDECKEVIGKVRLTAFDSAGAVYLYALKQAGMSVDGIKPEQAQVAWQAFVSGKRTAGKKTGVAEDSALDDVESDLLRDIQVRI